MQTVSLESFADRIKAAWTNTPAKVTVSEIMRKVQLPKWEDCKKDELYVGVIRRKRGDRLIVVKHQSEGDYDLSCSVEELDESFFSSLSPKGNQICKSCGEFSTRINVGDVCTDCLRRSKR